MLEINNVSKIFRTQADKKALPGGTVQAANNLNFTVRTGEIFGFLGPNGAGKTTTIRMILDIIRPDSGTISWHGRNVRELPRRTFGYLPEERGLYPKMEIEEQLLFVSQLFGANSADVKKRLGDWLDRFEISQNRRKKLEELSKGNQQKIQFLAAILHDPEILILDEPFSGLDPVNTEQLKSAFLDLHRAGKTIIFSTHQMDTVEEMCQNIVLINKGQTLLYGEVARIKAQSGRAFLKVALGNGHNPDWMGSLPGVTPVRRRADYLELEIAAPATPEDLLRRLVEKGEPVTRFELAAPSLHDIFVEKIGGKGAGSNQLSPLNPESGQLVRASNN
jgi:ABC-2 type transport system ATP-binding protein